MRVYYFYTKKHPKAVAALPPDAEFVYTGGGLGTYWEEIEKRWTGEDDIVFVEHDNVLHEDVIPEFSTCPEPWCAFPYFCGSMVGEWSPTSNKQVDPVWSNRGTLAPLTFATEALGCTKISQEAQCLVTVDDVLRINETSGYGCPDCGENNPGNPICWTHIDSFTSLAFKQAGLKVHVHPRPVDHLHYMVQD